VTVALPRALSTYFLAVVPAVRRELGRWRIQAEAIPDSVPRRHALTALAEKDSNSEAVALFAILAPRARRRAAIRSIVALQVAIDYLDTVDELGLGGDPGYLERLFDAHRTGAAALPSYDTVLPLLDRAVSRCGEGQRHTHLAEHGERDVLESWARARVDPAAYRWWEVAAGASSSVAAHALIAAAADPRTSRAEAELIDAAYFPSIGALTVLLDDLIDRDEDEVSGAHNYMAYYPDAVEAADRLELIAQLARSGIAPLRHRRRHEAILAGVLGFYLGSAEAESAFAGPVRERLLSSGGPAARAIATIMRHRRR
jgi:tetraprenyl-beta-curcumene synthase